MDAPRCLVLGGTGAVGRAVCAELLAQGARVAFGYRRNATRAAEMLARWPGAVAHAFDLAELDALRAGLDELARALGGVDVLIHAAAEGSTLDPPVFEDLAAVDPRGWDHLFAVNVRSAFFSCQHLAERFGPSGGNVVLLGSIDGVKTVPAPVPYAASKAALRGLASSLAKTLGKRNVRVNVVAPGVLEEGLSHTLPADLREQYLRHCALRRLGTTAEVARVVAWFGLRNTLVTGQTIVVDGGL